MGSKISSFCHRRTTSCKKLVLINTPSDSGLNGTKLGLLTIASYIRDNCYPVEIIEGTKEDILKKLESRIYTNCVFGMSATTDVINNAYYICKEIKRIYPVSTCVIGGMHASALPEQTLKESMFDIIVKGEGEQALLDIMKDNIKSGVIYSSPLDIDKIPQPAFDLIDIKSSLSEIRSDKVLTRKCMTVCLSRGCPFNCRFCSSEIVWKRNIRWHSTKYSIDQIKYLISNYGIDSISFVDDEFFSNKDFYVLVKELKKLNLVWECQARVTSVTKEKLELIKDSGCRLIKFGIESGSDKILSYLKMGSITVKDADNAIRLCKEVGINCYASFIIGSPQETVDDIIKTIDFIENSTLTSASLNILIPYPGTKIYDEIKVKYLQSCSWDDFRVEGEDTTPIMRNDNFTRKQLKDIHKYIKVQVIDPLNNGRKRRQLDHKKEIENILKGDMTMTMEKSIIKIRDILLKGMHHKNKIIPYIKRKIVG